MGNLVTASELKRRGRGQYRGQDGGHGRESGCVRQNPLLYCTVEIGKHGGVTCRY
jgi:hypothetical protein